MLHIIESKTGNNDIRFWNWKVGLYEFEAFATMLQTPKLVNTTCTEYHNMDKKSKSAIKASNGGYVTCITIDENGNELLTHTTNIIERKESLFKYRTTLVIELDSITQEIQSKIDSIKESHVIHSTCSHTPNDPHSRIIVELSKPIPVRYYHEVMTNFLNKYNIPFEVKKDEIIIQKGVCPSSKKVNQLMFYPVLTYDGEYIYKRNKGVLLDYDDFIISEDETPFTEEDTKTKDIPDDIRDMINTIIPPTEKTGPIGDFCKLYNIHKVIKEFLSEKYERVAEDRYLLKGSETGNAGAIVYPDRNGLCNQFLYSWHGKDPVNDDHCHNAFDVVRLHLFNGNFEKMYDFVKDLNIKIEEEEKASVLVDVMNDADYLDNMFETVNNELSNLPKNPTGFDELDKKLNGGLSYGLIVFGAGSSMGKTTIVHQISTNIAASGTKVLFFTLEQSRHELICKTLSRETYKIDKEKALSLNEIMNGQKNEVLTQAINTYKPIGINFETVEGNFNTTVQTIRNTIENKLLESPNDKYIIIIDYLQIIESAKDTYTDKKVVDINVKELKRITRDFKIPIIAIASLNRGGYSSSISFEAFKESGAIEYTADIVLGLEFTNFNSLKKEYAKDHEGLKKALKIEAMKPIREIRLVSLKNRAGGQYFDVKFLFNPKYNYFEQMSDAVNFNSDDESIETENNKTVDNDYKQDSSGDVIELYKRLSMKCNINRTNIIKEINNQLNVGDFKIKGYIHMFELSDDGIKFNGELKTEKKRLRALEIQGTPLDKLAESQKEEMKAKHHSQLAKDMALRELEDDINEPKETIEPF